jgi:hypothetical protein
MSKLNAKDLLKRMPKDYREVPYKLYQEMLNNVLIEKPAGMNEDDFKFYQSYSMLSILLNVPIDELAALPFITVKPLLDSLSFMDKSIVQVHSNINIKDAETLTYKEFQSLLYLLPEQWNNTIEILEIVVKDKTKEEIERLSVWEVAQCFFQLRIRYRKSLAHSRKSLGFQLLMMIMKNWVKKIFRIKG